MTPLHVHNGIRTTLAQRLACHEFQEARLDGLTTTSVAAFARRIGCHRSTVYRWLTREDVLPRTPGPAAGVLRRPLDGETAAYGLDFRTQGLSLMDVTEVLRDDFPERGVTRHQVATHAVQHEWPVLLPVAPKRVTSPFLNAPFGFLHADLVIGPLPGIDPVILTVREHHSRWFEAIALPSKHSAMVAAGLAVLLERIPMTITIVLTDCGSEFRGYFDRFLTSRCIEHRRTKPYTPQTNGMVERAKGLLKTFGPLRHTDWWLSRSGESATIGDLWKPDQATDRRMPRFQADLQRWSHWINLVRPNRQLSHRSPLAWCVANRHRCRQPVLDAILNSLAHQPRTRVVHGQRHLHAPPSWWPTPVVALSGST